MKRFKLRFRSIQTSISMSFSILIVVLIALVGILSYNITERVVEENSNEYVYSLIKQVNYDIEYYLKNVETTLNSLKYNEQVKAFYNNSQARAIDDDQYLSRYLNSYLLLRNDILNIFLISGDGRMLVNSGEHAIKKTVNYQNESWYHNAMTSEQMVVSGSHVQNILKGQYKWVVSCTSLIQNSENKNIKESGLLLIDLNFNLINDMVSRIQLGTKGYVFIIDKDGNIVYHPKQQLIYSGLKKESIDLILNSQDGVITVTEEGEKKHYVVTTSAYSGWKVVGTVYANDIKKYEPTLKRFFILMVIVALLVSVLLSSIISSNIVHPIKSLVKGMNLFKSGHLDATTNIEVDNEIGDLSNAFNLMTVQIKNLIKENKKVERNKRISDLEALQAQINPHFLYNTLDSIVWMSEAGNNAEVVKMTSSLAKLFRISINKGMEFVTLEKEIEHVESYLTIQKMRYGSKMTYSIKAEPALLNYKIVKIIIQPIVENAIYHGIKALPSSGHIDIEVTDVQDKICIEVRDNGVGMSQEVVEKLLSGQLDSENRKGGVGVKNVEQRIKLYYGQDYGITIESELYEGTSVKIWLPKTQVGQGVQDAEK